MKRASLVVCALLLLVSCMGVGISHAQGSLKVSIPFQFHAGQNVLPAGSYRIMTKNILGKVLTLSSLDSNKSWQVPFVTRLAQRANKKVELAFDKVEGESYLSEIHIPGIDGYALEGSPREHSHVQVTDGDGDGPISHRNQ
jgi:hypothetical protein